MAHHQRGIAGLLFGGSVKEVDQAVLGSESPESVAVVRAAARHAARAFVYEKYASPTAGLTQQELPPEVLAIRPLTSYAFLCQLSPTPQTSAVIEEETHLTTLAALQDYSPQINAKFAQEVYDKVERMLVGMWSQLTACCTCVGTAVGLAVSPTSPTSPGMDGGASGGSSSGGCSSNVSDVGCDAGSESDSCIASTRTSITLTNSAFAGSNGLRCRVAAARLSEA